MGTAEIYKIDGGWGGSVCSPLLLFPSDCMFRVIKLIAGFALSVLGVPAFAAEAHGLSAAAEPLFQVGPLPITNSMVTSWIIAVALVAGGAIAWWSGLLGSTSRNIGPNLTLYGNIDIRQPASLEIARLVREVLDEDVVAIPVGDRGRPELAREREGDSLSLLRSPHARGRARLLPRPRPASRQH